MPRVPGLRVISGLICQNADMIPLRDVVPSRTVPFITIGLIALNGLAFVFELSLPEASLEPFPAVYGVVPAGAQLADDLHVHVPARRLAAPSRQHALPVDLRRQRRGRARARPLRGVLLRVRIPAAAAQVVFNAARRCRPSAPAARSPACLAPIGDVPARANGDAGADVLLRQFIEVPAPSSSGSGS